MAKKLRFPLEMENGIEVRTLEELKDNFSLGKVYSYYNDGKLLTWLKDRYLDDIAEKIEALDKNSQDFTQKLCSVFGVEYIQNSVDLEIEEEKNRRIDRVKEYTEDSKYIDGIERVAFDQDELYDLLDEGMSEIYLCGDKFEIPLGKSGITYEGINNPVVIINSDKLVDWTNIGITISKVQFNDAYQQLLELKEKENVDILKKNDLFEDYYNLNGNDLLQRIEKEIDTNSEIADKARYMLERLMNYSYKAANESKYDRKEQLKIASDNGYKAAVLRYAVNYLSQNEKNEIYADFIEKNIEGNLLSEEEKNDPFILYELGIAYLNNDEKKQESIGLIQKAAERGLWIAELSMGIRYENGGVVEKNYYKAIDWYKKVADKGLSMASYYLAEIAIFNVPDKKEIGQEYIKKAFEDKDFKESYMNSDNGYVNNPGKETFVLVDGPYQAPLMLEHGTHSEVRIKAERVVSKYISAANNAFCKDAKGYIRLVNGYKKAFQYRLKRFLLTAIADGRVDYGNSSELKEYLLEKEKELENIFSNHLYNAAPNLNVSSYLNVDYRIQKALGSGFFDDDYDAEGTCETRCLETLHNSCIRAKKNFEDSCYSSYREVIRKLYGEIV